MLPSQPIILALQALKLGDRFLARGCLPARVHVPVNGTFEKSVQVQTIGSTLPPPLSDSRHPLNKDKDDW
jgi:hypothetical protein